MKAWLETNEGQNVSLQGACLIGRSSNCCVVLADAHISRRHTLVQQQNDDEFWLVDLGSSNGTKLNGRRLSQPCRLKVGDSFRISDHEFRFRTASPSLSFRATESLGLHAQITKRCSMIETLSCWMLLADIIGSVELGQLTPPDEWPQIVGHWLLNCRDEIESVGGTLNKYLGDGLFAFLAEGPESAVRIRSLMMKLGSLQLQQKPPFRVVLHHGSVTTGGASASGEESLLGAEVNFAFRLEKVAGKVGTTLLLSSAARALWPQPEELTSLGGHFVPNFEGTHEVFELKPSPSEMCEVNLPN
jgi:adenylate cyclase